MPLCSTIFGKKSSFTSHSCSDPHLILDNAEQYGLYLSNVMNNTVGRRLWAKANIG